MAPSPRTPYRAANLEVAAAAGFTVAPSLPSLHEPARTLRPVEEIAQRLMALDALFTWVVTPERMNPSRTLRAFVERNRLDEALTAEEQAIWSRPRNAVERFRNNIGWRLENMWPLAWALGFTELPPIDGRMITDEQTEAMMTYLPSFEAATADVLAKARVRPEKEILAAEDLFYCVHNAARSARLGHATVPSDFHPGLAGGVIHERRHALTWATSPGIAWNDTDLST